MTEMTESSVLPGGELTVDRLLVDVQNALSQSPLSSNMTLPSVDQISRWANLAYRAVSQQSSEVTIRLVDVAEITQLNREYRHKDKATNVLSFPFEADFPLVGGMMGQLLDDTESDPFVLDLLGDIVVCCDVIEKEAVEQSKKTADHYAHMIIHGVLHLCGYDHINEQDAEQMESLEVSILAQAQIQNPYI